MINKKVIERIDAILPVLKLVIPGGKYFEIAEQFYVLLKMPSAERKARIDEIFDGIEDYVQSTDNKVDDVIVLPAILGLRKLMDIPDND